MRARAAAALGRMYRGSEPREGDDDAAFQLHPIAFRITNVVALLVTLLSLALFVVSIPARFGELYRQDFTVERRFAVLSSSEPQAIAAALARLQIPAGTFAAVTLAIEIAFALFFLVLATLVVRYRRGNCWTRLVALTLVLFGTAGPPTMLALAGNPLADLPVHILNRAAWVLLGLLFCLFPNGRFFPRWTLPLAGGWIGWQIGQVALRGTIVDPATWLPLLAFFVSIGWFLAGVLAQAERCRQVSTALERQQAKWVFFGLTLSFAGALAAVLPGLLVPSLPEHGRIGALYVLAREPLSLAFVLLLPLCFALAILRYRLWEIDFFISRALVYVPLTAIVAGLYTACLVLFQHLVLGLAGTTSSAALVLTTLVVASVLTPLKGALERVVDRSLRSEPDAEHALLAYERQVDAVTKVLDIDQVTCQLLSLAVEMTGAAGGALFLRQHGDLRRVQVSGAWSGEEALSLPLVSAGRELGHLALGPNPQRPGFSERERRTLETAASRAAGAIALAESLDEMLFERAGELTPSLS